MAYVLAQSNPTATTNTDLYTVPAGKEAVVSTIAVCEHNGVATTFQVLVRDNGDAAAAKHRLIYNAPLNANQTQFFTVGLAMATSDVLTVQAGTGDVTFQAFVSETDA